MGRCPCAWICYKNYPSGDGFSGLMALKGFIVPFRQQAIAWHSWRRAILQIQQPPSIASLAAAHPCRSSSIISVFYALHKESFASVFAHSRRFVARVKPPPPSE